MVWDLSEKEREGVLRLAPPDRYRYFIRKAADEEVLWGLWLNGWALTSDEDGHEAVPIWPHAAFAEACAIDEWKEYIPKQIDLDNWVEHWLPGIQRDGRLIAVFPSPDDKGVVVGADRFAHDLEDEIRNY